MHKVVVAGAGKIGSLITTLFLESGDYAVTLIDTNLEGHDAKRLPQCDKLKKVVVDVTDEKQLADFLRQHPHDAIVSSLPFYCNPL